MRARCIQLVHTGLRNSAPHLEPTTAFYIFLAANVVAAVFSPIQDCDEVFNYWEPTHYLNHGHGLQTWEYSPEYAIRSWAYVGMHAAVIWIGHLLPFVGGKAAEFYSLRVVLAIVCAVCETRLYSTISRTMNPRVAAFFLMAMVFSPGMYHASTAYLPSSFAMYTTMLGFSAFMDWQDGIRTAQGIFWFALGSLLGWPFAGALVIPFLAEEIILASITGELYSGFRRVVDGAVRSLIVLVRLSMMCRSKLIRSLGRPIFFRFLFLPKVCCCAPQHRSLQCLQWR